MDLGIRGRRALVTGSTAGIGLAIAAALRRGGVHLVVNGRTAARVEETVRRLEEGEPAAASTASRRTSGRAREPWP